MGNVRRIRQRAETPTLSEAITAYLATLDHPETAGTRHVYASTLRQLRRHLGAEIPVAALDEPATGTRLAGWFTDRWGTRAPATFNRNLDAIRSAVGYWRDQDWFTTNPTWSLRRRGRALDRTRRCRAPKSKPCSPARISACASACCGGCCVRPQPAAARSSPLMSRIWICPTAAQVRRKGNAADVIVWQTATARLLPRLLKGRRSGPVFVTNRRTRVELPPSDLDPTTGRARLS